VKILNIKINEKSTGVFIVELAGPLDTYTHELFNYKMETILLPSTKVIVLDMAGVDYISSMGIGSIFKIRKFAKDSNMEFAIVNLQPQVERVFNTVQAMPKEAIFSSLSEIDAYLDQIQKEKQD
jgi:anti-sigma B factor antagonist